MSDSPTEATASTQSPKPDYKQAQREAEYASRMVYRPQAGTKIVRDHDGRAFTFVNGQARKLQERLTGRAARWRRRIAERARASLSEHPYYEHADPTEFIEAADKFTASQQGVERAA